MENNDLKSIFNKILSKNISPYFKTLNFKKKGNNFKYFNSIENYGEIVNFQKSQFYQIRFTINIGIYLPEFQYYDYNIPKISNENFNEPDCALRRRIGILIDGFDKWYDLNEETNINELISELENDFTKYILPYLEKFQNKNYVLEQLLDERCIGFNEVTRVKVLWRNGYKNEILELLKNEKYHREYKGEIFDEIKNWIKENE